MVAPSESADHTVTRADIRATAEDNIKQGLASWEMVHWYFGAQGTLSRHRTMASYVDYLDHIYLKEPVRNPMLQLPTTQDITEFHTKIQEDAFPIGVSTEPAEIDDIHSVFCFTLTSARPLVFAGSRESRGVWIPAVADSIHGYLKSVNTHNLEVITIGSDGEKGLFIPHLIADRDAVYTYETIPPNMWDYFRNLPTHRSNHQAPTKSIILLTDDGRHPEELAMMLEIGKTQPDTHVIMFTDAAQIDHVPSDTVVLGCEGVEFTGIEVPVMRSQAVLLNDPDLPRYWALVPTQ